MHVTKHFLLYHGHCNFLLVLVFSNNGTTCTNCRKSQKYVFAHLRVLVAKGTTNSLARFPCSAQRPWPRAYAHSGAARHLEGRGHRRICVHASHVLRKGSGHSRTTHNIAMVIYSSSFAQMPWWVSSACVPPVAVGLGKFVL